MMMKNILLKFEKSRVFIIEENLQKISLNMISRLCSIIRLVINLNSRPTMTTVCVCKRNLVHTQNEKKNYWKLKTASSNYIFKIAYDFFFFLIFTYGLFLLQNHGLGFKTTRLVIMHFIRGLSFNNASSKNRI